MSIEEVFAELVAHTRPKCGQCRIPHSCCHAEACEGTIELAKEIFGVDLQRTDHPTLPLMGSDGCTAAPHHRPICAVHVCGQHLKDDEWSERYWELREIAGEALELRTP